MTENPFDDALESAASETDTTSEEQTAPADTNEIDAGYETLTTAPKTKTVGIAVSEEMHAFYQELQHAEEVDTDISQSIRDHIEKLAHRHDQVFERAMRKLEIEREY